MKAEIEKTISRCENLTDWDNDANCTMSLESTEIKEGLHSIKRHVVDTGGPVVESDIWYDFPTAIDLSAFTHINLWNYCPTSVLTQFDAGFRLYTDAGNHAYWGLPYITAWHLHTLDLSSPSSETGTLDLSNITKMEFWAKLKLTLDLYVDLIVAYKDVTADFLKCKIVEELYTPSYAEMMVKAESLDVFQAGDEINIYDSDDVLSWSGRILYPTAVRKGTEIIGELKVLGIDSDLGKVFRKNFTTLRDSDYILKYILDNAGMKYMHYDDEVDNFAITYKYDLKTKIWKMFNYLAMLERAVIHYKPDGEIFFNKYDNLTASGMVWDQDTGHVKITSYSPAANRHITEVPVIGTVNSKGQVYYIGTGTDLDIQKYGINQLQAWKDPEISNYTEAKQLGDNLLAIYSMDTQIIKMLTVGKKHIQVGYTINVAWTGLFTIAAADFLVTKRVWYPMIDLCELMLTDNILTEKAFNIKVINKFYDEDSQEHTEIPDMPESTADGTVIPGARHDKFVWRVPEPGSADFQEGGGSTDFSTIGDVTATWYELDLSSVIPVGTVAILINIFVKDGVADSEMAFRKAGQTTFWQKASIRTQVANIYPAPNELIIGVDSDRKIEWNCTPKASDWTEIYFIVIGYWI